MRLERAGDHWWLIGGPVPPGAAAIRPVVSVRERRAGDQRLGRHEAEHVRQWRR